MGKLLIWVVLFIIVTAICIICAYKEFECELINVSGDSMYPTFKNGDILLFSRCKRKLGFRNAKIHNIYTYYEPEQNKLVVKRLSRMHYSYSEKDFLFWFFGDNKLVSKDSREYGLIPSKRIRGEYIMKLHILSFINRMWGVFNG